MPSLRSFLVNVPNNNGRFPFNSTTAWFWEIRLSGPPPEDLNAHAGDIYLDISTVQPIGVYQMTAIGWTSCWSQSPNVSKKEFVKLPHPRFKDYLLWTTETKYSSELSLSYIALEELNSRGGTEADKQVCLLEDLKTFYPSITTVETLVARREAALQANDDSSSSIVDVGNESDGIFVEEDLCDDGDDDSEETDETKSDASGSDFVDKAEGGSAQTKSEMPSPSSKPFRNISVCYNLKSILPVKESDTIETVLSGFTRALEKERKETENLLSKELADTKAKLKETEKAKNSLEVAYNYISFENKAIKTEREKVIDIKDALVGILKDILIGNRDEDI